MSRRLSLLESISGLLARTYDMRHGLSDLAPFVIGDDGYRRFYAEQSVSSVHHGQDGRTARTARAREPWCAIRRTSCAPPSISRIR